YQAFYVVSDDGIYGRVGRPNLDNTRASRQVYIPTTGTYYVTIHDLRNFNANPGMHGGPTGTYRLELTRETVAPTSVTLPVTAQAGTVSASGDVQLFSFGATVGQGLHAETRAQRLGTPSSVDTILYIIDRTSGTPGVLAYNDDGNQTGGALD